MKHTIEIHISKKCDLSSLVQLGTKLEELSIRWTILHLKSYAMLLITIDNDSKVSSLVELGIILGNYIKHEHIL